MPDDESQNERLAEELEQARSQNARLSEENAQLRRRLSADGVEASGARREMRADIVGLERELTDQREAAEMARIDALQRTDAFKDRLLSILSHELRTPLNVIVGFATLLEDELIDQLTVDQREYFSKLIASSDDLLALVNDFLDMSRLLAGKFTIAPRLVSFPEIVENVVANRAASAAKRGVAIRNEVAELPDLMADEQRLAQILDNLLTNALKFTPRGGSVCVRACISDGKLRCEVEDTGIGITPAKQARIFGRFSQLDMTSTRETGGVGLGLPITKALVEAHGGTIGVQSQPDRGSTFWFELPLTRAPIGHSKVQILSPTLPQEDR